VEKKLCMVLVALMFIFTFFNIASFSTAQTSHPVGVYGIVSDTDGNPVSNASVNVSNTDLNTYATATTNEDGEYAVSLQSNDGDTLSIYARKNISFGYNTTTVDLSNTTHYLNVTLGGPLKAMFTYYPKNPAPGETIHFVDRSVGTISEYEWNFGDGMSQFTSLGNDQYHSYDKEGVYTVSLKVIHGNNFDKTSKNIVVKTGQDPRIPPLQPPEYPEGYTVQEMYQLLNGMDLPESKEKLRIVVMDTGVYPRSYHGIDLSNITRSHHKSFADGIDRMGHGTMVNYIVAYLVQNKIPNAEHISYKALGREGGSSAQVFLESLKTVEKLKPDIVTISAGAYGNPSDVFSKQIEHMRDQGIIVVSCAAGNNGPSESTVLSPAVSPASIAVAASQPRQTINDLSDDTIAPWSSRGPVPIDETKPDLTAPGESILGPFLGQERVLSGTSLSTPFVAAGSATIVANHKAKINVVKTLYFWNPGIISDTMEDSLEESCYRKGDKNSWGAGIVQFDEANKIFGQKLTTLILLYIVLLVAIIFAVIGTIYYFKFYKKKKEWKIWK
jgi:PKD repeat protein